MNSPTIADLERIFDEVANSGGKSFTTQQINQLFDNVAAVWPKLDGGGRGTFAVGLLQLDSTRAMPFVKANLDAADADSMASLAVGILESKDAKLKSLAQLKPTSFARGSNSHVLTKRRIAS